MIDYYAHAAALDAVTADVAALSATNPDISAITDSLIAEAATEPEAAFLGAVVDHLMVHAASDGTELRLLETAAALWQDATALYDSITAARKDIESALADTSQADAIAKFNSGTAAVAAFKPVANDVAARCNNLLAEIAPMPHLRGHPRQADEPIDAWDWGNRFAGRRADAFTRATFAEAQGPSGRAFALGVLASYATNATGSSYVGHVVGGPRRSHRFRNRLARNTIGAWVSQNLSAATLPTMAALAGFGATASTAALPQDVETTLTLALESAFPGVPLPDLAVGHQRLVRHLELLSIFVRPDLPAPPDVGLAPLLSTVPATSGGSVHPLADDPTGTGPPEPGSGSGTPSTADSKDSSGNVCALIIAAAVLLGVIIIDCIVQLIDHGDCDPGDTLEEILGGDDEPEEVTSEGQLISIASSPAGAALVQNLFQMQMTLWQAFDQAFNYLVLTGLIYPDALLMGSPLYSQFCAIPNRFGWPRQIDPNADATYQAYPGTPVEQPAADASLYVAGATPDVFINSSESRATAGGLAAALWSQVARRQLDSNNLDLDADRGFRHGCWTVRRGTSIADQPLDVEVLQYNAV